jgi:hypothetical protein
LIFFNATLFPNQKEKMLQSVNKYTDKNIKYKCIWDIVLQFAKNENCKLYIYIPFYYTIS